MVAFSWLSVEGTLRRVVCVHTHVCMHILCMCSRGYIDTYIVVCNMHCSRDFDEDAGRPFV